MPPGEYVSRPSEDSQPVTSRSTWHDFRRWKTPTQLFMICLLPFILIFVGCVLMGLVWSERVESSRQIVLTCGMVSFFSGFLTCVIANFCDACGLTCMRYDEPLESEAQNQTLFVDLGDLGPSLVDQEENLTGDSDKSEVQTTLVELEENTAG